MWHLWRFGWEINFLSRKLFFQPAVNEHTVYLYELKLGAMS